MGPLGWQETVFIFVLALLIFGPKKLPELGKNVAKALGEFRRASNELKDTWNREMAAVEKETEPIRQEAESLRQTTAEYAESTYNYDSSYDYGSYSYPDSYDSETTTESSAVSASATQGADSSTDPGETSDVVAVDSPSNGASGDGEQPVSSSETDPTRTPSATNA